MIFCKLIFSIIALHSAYSAQSIYSPRGVGGGGALASFSISPYSDLRFVGTDMGTLYRSTNRGKSWSPVHQSQITFNSNLELASEIGFSSDAKTVFFADAGKNPKRSQDSGVTWSSIFVPLEPDERILYWTSDSKNSKIIYCATTDGLLKSKDKGKSWKRVSAIKGASLGTVILPEIYHATPTAIFLSRDQGETFQVWHSPKSKIRAFTGGKDAKSLTLAFIDSQGKEACKWSAGDQNTLKECGFVWVHQDSKDSTAPHFSQTKQEGGRFVRMAENNSQTIYVTGGNWIKQYGSKIWVSENAGKTWNLRMHVYDWDKRPYQPWPKEKLEYSAIGLDVGWDDNAPFSFSVNRFNAKEAGGTGHYYLHVTSDSGQHWSAPFTKYADTGERKRGKKWKSTGLEITSALRLKFHPKNKKLGYVSLADIGGYVTEDGGQTWRISKVKYNTNYDYAFDPEKPNRVYAASGNKHDFPLNINTPIAGEGGIFISDDCGLKWKNLTPLTGAFHRQFISVAFDPIHRIIYGGTQGGGIAKSSDEGRHWEWMNTGFQPGDLVIPQLEIDPKDGTLYALLTGNAPEFKNSADTGIYRIRAGKWERLRHTVKRPANVDEKYPLWLFPSSFAVDFSRPKRDVIWLTDIENKGAWLATGVWKTTNSGETWVRKTQFTHPTHIKIEPGHPNSVTVSGPYEVTGEWGVGGSLRTADGGESWKKNEKLPLLANLFSYTEDPSRSDYGFFLFFGGGIFYGPNFPQ